MDRSLSAKLNSFNSVGTTHDLPLPHGYAFRFQGILPKSGDGSVTGRCDYLATPMVSAAAYPDFSKAQVAMQKLEGPHSMDGVWADKPLDFCFVR